jgi:hypothetical protein
LELDAAPEKLFEMMRLDLREMAVRDQRIEPPEAIRLEVSLTACRKMVEVCSFSVTNVYHY